SVAALSRVLLLEQGLVTSRPRHGLAGLCLTTPAGHWPVRRYLPYGFGLFPVRSPLLREWSLFLGVLRCFSSPGSLPDKVGVIRFVISRLIYTASGFLLSRYLGRLGACRLWTRTTGQFLPRPGTCPRGLWWSRGDSNPRPPPCKGGALPAELRPHF